jgi:glycosyltransferase involved in cell wall biosynthesis
VPRFVAAISGQGYAFTDGAPAARRIVARTAIQLGARAAFGHRCMRVIVQNEHDHRTILGSRLANSGQVVLIRGSGVDLARFADACLSDKQPIVLMPARMLRDKGVMEFAAAASLLRDRGCSWRFMLAGDIDLQNPSRVDENTLRDWNRTQTPEWLGYVRDMTSLYRVASIVCLPSYREGLPKSLIEGAAAACAVVTTDVPGCRDAIIPGVTGDLVPVRDATALADAIQALIADRTRRECYGVAGRDLARRVFGLESIVQQTLAVYDELLAS